MWVARQFLMKQVSIKNNSVSQKWTQWYEKMKREREERNEIRWDEMRWDIMKWNEFLLSYSFFAYHLLADLIDFESNDSLGESFASVSNRHLMWFTSRWYLCYEGQDEERTRKKRKRKKNHAPLALVRVSSVTGREKETRRLEDSWDKDARKWEKTKRESKKEMHLFIYPLAFIRRCTRDD